MWRGHFCGFLGILAEAEELNIVKKLLEEAAALEN